METLGSIKDVLDSNPTSKYIVLGDFNYNLYDTQLEMSLVLRNFIDDYDLCSSHDLDSSFNLGSSYTRCCIKSSSYSLLDYVFFSRSLRGRVSNCTTIYDGANPSDHLPVEIQLEVEPQHTGERGNSNGHIPGKIDWPALSPDELLSYENVMGELLDTIHIPSDALHGNRHCSDPSHHFIL